MKQTVDTFIVGRVLAKKATKAVKEKRDDKGRVTVLAEPAHEKVEAKAGYKVNLRMPIEFDVLLKSSELMGMTVVETVRAGEIIVRAQVISDPDYLEVDQDGRLMFALCAGVAAKYMNPEDVEEVKKNSITKPTST